MKIFVSGSLAYDRIMDFPGNFSDHILPEKLHILNVCFTVNGLKEKFGGTAGNIAYSLALLGEKPLVLAACGRDFDRYEKWLRENGLSLDGIKRIEGELTAGAYITTDQADNQITGFNPGAMNHPSRFEFGKVNHSKSLAIISPGNLEDMLAYPQIFKERRIPYIFDPGQSITSFSGDQLLEMMTGAEIFISNDYELEMVMRATGLDKKELLKRTKAIITTLGEKGSLVCANREQVEIPAVKVSQSPDPTGAGDAYRAGLIKGLALGRDLSEAARMGATSASYAVESYGTQEHRYTESEFWERRKTGFAQRP